jgi:NADPH2:quinone reductase
VQTFKAYRTFEQDKVVQSRFVDMTEAELDPGDVLIRTKYSTINYKDALSYNGTGRIMRKYPTVAGIDMAGTVERSNDARWKRGDKVIVTGYDLGVAHDGGYAELVRVPADWVVRRPESMTAFDAMTLGTAGFTAALAIHLMEHNGLEPGHGASPSPAPPAAWARSRSRSWPSRDTTSSPSPARRRRPNT